MRSRRSVIAGAILAAVLAGIVCAQAYDAGAELALVEKLAKARDDYRSAVTELYNFYLRTGDASSAKRAERELRAYGMIEQYDYATKTAGPEAEAPVAVLQYVAEADDYYVDGTLFADSNRKSYRDLALKRFEKVLTTWPTSDKAPAAAFKMGEVYSSLYYKDFDLAAKYYTKCYEIDPATTLPALLKAADMYYKLERWDEAVKMYKLAVEGSRDVKVKQQAEDALDRLAKMGH